MILVKIGLVISVSVLFFHHGSRFNSLMAREGEKNFALLNGEELKRRRKYYSISIFLYFSILLMVALLSRYTKVFW